MWSFVVSFVVGVFLWTLMEYLLHRFVGHRPGRNLMSREHKAHHATTNYFAPAWRKVLAAIPVLSVLFLLAWPAVGWHLALAGVCGTAAGWLFYERLHLRLHTTGPKTAYDRWACRHHFDHHFMNPKLNHGVSSPLWDIVFGTHQAARAVRVPRRQAGRLIWLARASADEATAMGYAVV